MKNTIKSKKTLTSLLIFVLLFINIAFSNTNEVNNQLIKTQKEIRYFKSTTLPLVFAKEDFLKIKWKNWGKTYFRFVLASYSYGASELFKKWDYKKYKKDFFVENNTNIQKKVLGTIKYSTGIIGLCKNKNIENYNLWHISVPLLIEPTWERLNECADDFSNIKLSFQLFDENNKETAQIVDILPNTRFDPANYGGKASFNVKIGANKRWQAIEASAESKANFWWNWNPKVLVAASGAAGNYAFCLLNQKPDGTGWIGQVPVELLIQIPKENKKYTLQVETILMFKEKHTIKLGESKIDVYLD